METQCYLLFYFVKDNVDETPIETLGIYTCGKKKQCIFEIAVEIEECEGNAKLHSRILTYS